MVLCSLTASVSMSAAFTNERLNDPASHLGRLAEVQALVGALDRPRVPRQGVKMPDDSIDELSFEAALKRLEEIVRTLETGQAPLDESIALYAEGDRLKRQCEARLNAAQVRIDKITLGPGGAPTGTQPFDAA